MNDVRKILQLMLPILVTMLTVAGMQSIDIIMSGHASNIDVAGVSIAGNVWFPLYTGLNGILIAVMTIFSNLIGANRQGDLASVLRHALYLAVVVGIALIVLINISIRYVQIFLPLEREVLQVAVGYVFALSWGVIPLCIVNTLRQFVESLNHARVVTVTMLCALPINVLVNYLLIFGKCGFPKLGGVGAGYATSVTYTFICLVLLYICTKVQPFAGHDIWQKVELNTKRFAEQLRLGIPIGVTIFFEVAMFNALGMLVVKFGTETIAANQAAISISTMTYMLVLSLSIALNIVIGYAIGAKDYVQAEALSLTGLKMSLTITTCMIFFLLVCRDLVAGIYNSDPQAQVLIKKFLWFVVFYQLADGVAVASQGIMRAYRDVRLSFFITTTAYWGICLPVGIVLDRVFDFGITSYWQGLVVGIICAAFASYWRVRYLHRRTGIWM